MRLDNPQLQFSPLNFTTGQILNVLMIVGALLCMAVLRARSQRVVPRQRQTARTSERCERG